MPRSDEVAWDAASPYTPEWGAGFGLVSLSRRRAPEKVSMPSSGSQRAANVSEALGDRMSDQRCSSSVVGVEELSALESSMGRNICEVWILCWDEEDGARMGWTTHLDFARKTHGEAADQCSVEIR